MPETRSDPTPLIVTVGVVSREGRFLIARRRPGDSFAGYWEFPGGKVNPGEELRAALERELLEELGIRVEVGAQRMMIEHRTPSRAIRLHCFDCRWVEEEPRALECAECRWVRAEEFDKFRFPPASVALIQSLHKDTASQPLGPHHFRPWNDF